MNVARVRGTVVASRRSDGIDDARYLLVEDCAPDGRGRGDWIVALDLVGADRGQLVLCSQGSPCRQTAETDGRPMDALVVAIVDSIDSSGVYLYKVE